MDNIVSGVGVIDKSMAIVDALAVKPLALAELASVTGLNRATAHRLAVALEQHRMVRRIGDGRFALGYRFLFVAQQIDGLGPLIDAAQPHLRNLSDLLGESSQLYVLDRNERVCVAVAESEHGLRTIVPVGARLTLERGSAGAVLGERVGPTEYAVSIGEREDGVASVSCAVVGLDGSVIAALSVSGPIERMGAEPGGVFGPVLLTEAAGLSDSYSSRSTTSTESVPPGAS